LPIILVAEDLHEGRLTRLLPDYDPGQIVIQAVYPASRHLTVKVRSFLDFLVKRLHEQPVLLGYLTADDAEIAA
jgi:DNA-binding transcriptional LysR family regulator